MKAARLAVFLLAALGLSLHAHAEDEDAYQNDAPAQYQNDYDRDVGLFDDEFYGEEVSVNGDYKADAFGYYSADHDYTAEDVQGFRAFYGDADQGWTEF